MRNIILLIALLASSTAFADAKIKYVGAISIQPSQDAKVLADWYGHFGIELKEFHGGYYGKLDTAAGMFAFGIHPKKASAAKKSSGSVSVVFSVEDYDGLLASLKKGGITPASTEGDDTGQFAHFVDPDGNEITLWGQGH
jgi:predicted enzyme related to lactoylglutathione lyase